MFPTSVLFSRKVIVLTKYPVRLFPSIPAFLSGMCSKKSVFPESHSISKFIISVKVFPSFVVVCFLEHKLTLWGIFPFWLCTPDKLSMCRGDSVSTFCLCPRWLLSWLDLNPFWYVSVSIIWLNFPHCGVPLHVDYWNNLLYFLLLSAFSVVTYYIQSAML